MSASRSDGGGPRLSVLLAAHNPHRGRLARTLDGLAAQTLPREQWELIVTDNASSPPLEPAELRLAAEDRLIRESRPGLVHARLAGLRASRGELILFCDDDNVLAPDYLARAVELFAADPRLGNAAGKSLPDFEVDPPEWLQEFALCLALRDFSDERRIADGKSSAYPAFAFGGGGAVFRRAALAAFERSHERGSEPLITGRTGTSLSSGEDNSIVMSVLEAGWKVGYFPELVLRHLIPAGRLETPYLGRLNRGIAKSWVQVLALHGLCPWPPAAPWTLPFRKVRAYLRNRAWAGPVEYIRWQGACGHFEGRASIPAIRAQRGS